MKISDQRKLITLIDRFLDVPAINAARHGSNAADRLACQIETLLTELRCYVETDDGETVLAASLLGRRGGLATSEAKREAVRENGRQGGRPPHAKPSATALYKRERRAIKKNI